MFPKLALLVGKFQGVKKKTHINVEEKKGNDGLLKEGWIQ
jgi:hypothetical protein